MVYVSFGSTVWGLKISNTHFIWVVRESEEKNIRIKFLEEITCDEKGLVVNWYSQLEVLSHKSVRCFMSHFGWNSTLEALSLGVPMIAMPTNGKFIEDVWGVGIRVKVDEKDFVKREEVEMYVHKGNDGGGERE